MSRYMHKLAEALRTREQYLEEHSAKPIFETEEGEALKNDYVALVAEVQEFLAHVNDLLEKGEDFAEHFEHEFEDREEQLSVRINAWVKSIQKK